MSHLSEITRTTKREMLICSQTENTTYWILVLRFKDADYPKKRIKLLLKQSPGKLTIATSICHSFYTNWPEELFLFGMRNKLLTRCLLTQDFSCGCQTIMSTESRCLGSLCLCHSLDNHYQNLSSWVIFVTINQEATRKRRPCPPHFPGKYFSVSWK